LRIAIVIVALAAIAVAMVHIRRTRTNLRNEIQRMENQQISLRRELQDQQIRLGRAMAPSEIRRRAEEMALPMVDRLKVTGEMTTGRATHGR